MEREKQSLREFIQNYESGRYANPDVNTMIDAGWFDWFCDEKSLKRKLERLFPKIVQIAHSVKIDVDNTYVLFKNNCPMQGHLYDDFRFCDLETGKVIYTVVPASGHTRNKGQAELWGCENGFEEALIRGRWTDIKKYFGVEKRR